jgi:hypothetical protein
MFRYVSYEQEEIDVTDVKDLAQCRQAEGTTRVGEIDTCAHEQGCR